MTLTRSALFKAGMLAIAALSVISLSALPALSNVFSQTHSTEAIL